jgi:transcriptional regulator with PAS, ATPase and Fis domain
MDDSFTRLLACKNMGAVVFDQQLNISRIDRNAKSIILAVGSPDHEKDLLSLFPEFIGSEEILENIALGKKKEFRLDYVNRVDSRGAVRYIHLLVMFSGDPDQGLLVIEDASEQGLAVQQANQQGYELYLLKYHDRFRRHRISDSLIGESGDIKEVRTIIQKLNHAPKTTVLITGETGTGKSHTARVIHNSCMPVDAPFVEINCAALPEQLIESELFGYERGAFTHAVAAKPGLLEEAQGGTIFLDEIGELSPKVQSKLLAVLETKAFRRLGSNTMFEVNARLIAATNRDLQKAVAEKAFREDLYYRLNVVTLKLPPLREMGSDIVLLADHLLNIFNLELKKQVREISAEAQQVLLSHTWPGNVRELSNCLERAMIFIETDTIQASDLSLFDSHSSGGPQKWTVPTGGIVLDDVERQLILSALQMADNNKSKAARLLGLSRDTLRYRLEKYSLD